MRSCRSGSAAGGAIAGKLAGALGETAAEGASIPDSTIIARGGQSSLPPPGEVFSGAQGQTAEEGDALVWRGGMNTAERFANASGVTSDEAGKVYDVSVNSAPGRSIEELSQGIPNKQIGVTTVGEIRKAGGTIRLDPLENNPFHCRIGGCTPERFSELFTPTIKNPWTG